MKMFYCLFFCLPGLATASQINPIQNFSGTWVLQSSDRFDFAGSLVRSQGVATDQKGHYWYSANRNLLRADSLLGSAATNNSQPIPTALANQGDNHIGDIDYASGKIYAPIEDGSSYKHPYVAIFDAQNLRIEKYFSLPLDPQIDGVPWLAVDASSQRAYSSIYGNCEQINVYDLSTFTLVGFIPLSQTLHHVQGAKVYQGMMFATSDNGSDKSVYKIDLASGQVEKIISLPSRVHELEGLAVENSPQGLILDVLTLAYRTDQNHSTLLDLRSEMMVYREVSAP